MNFSTLLETLVAIVPSRNPVLIQGPPGIGKTALGVLAADRLDYRVVFSHPVIDDPLDYKGMGWVTDGRAEFLPFGTIEDLTTTKEPTVWFIDDLGQAPPMVQASLMQWIHRDSRQLGGKKLSEQVSIVAATNRTEDRAGVAGFLEPVKSRFASILRLDVDTEEWFAWALADGGILPEILAFLRWRPELLWSFKPSTDLAQSPTPRGWENASRMLALDLPHTAIHEVLEGSVGSGAAAELVGFLRVFLGLPDLDLIFQCPDRATVPTDPATLFALTGALAHAVAPDTLSQALKYSAGLPKEFDVLFVTTATRKRPELCDTHAYIGWADENQAVLL